MPFLFKCQYTRRPGDTWLGATRPRRALIVHAVDPPAIQAPPVPIGSTGQDLAGAVRDIGANPAAVLQGPQGLRSGNGRGSPA